MPCLAFHVPHGAGQEEAESRQGQPHVGRIGIASEAARMAHVYHAHGRGHVAAGVNVFFRRRPVGTAGPTD